MSAVTRTGWVRKWCVRRNLTFMKFKFYLVFWVGVILFNLALIAGLIWVAIHFARKWW